MAVSNKLFLSQTQNLVMTPQLQQAIKLLQFSNIELSEFITKELEENPLLMEKETDPNSVTDHSPQDERKDKEDLWSVDDAEKKMDEENTENLWTNDSKTDNPSYSNTEKTITNPSASYSDFNNTTDIIEKTLANEISLRHHLLEQLSIDIEDPTDRLVGSILIDMVDEAGYIDKNIEDIAKIVNCDCIYLERLVQKLQQFDPVGVFARDLQECLTLQLREQNLLDSKMLLLLENLEMIASQSFDQLMDILDVEFDELKDMVMIIKELNPKPGFEFSHNEAQTVVPDLILTKMPDESWSVEINPDTLPKIAVDHGFYKQVSTSPQKKEEKKYLEERAQSANWLIRSLEQRTETILKVTAEIIRRQSDFFTHGVEYLKPLTLREVAEIVDMHESTISRVTTNKYISTPRGTFELKYFFSTSLSSNLGDDCHSALSVKQKIKDLIDKETIDNIYSDEKIAQILQEQNIDIARRTVAKYRESMNIPTSSVRKKSKKFNLI